MPFLLKDITVLVMANSIKEWVIWFVPSYNIPSNLSVNLTSINEYKPPILQANEADKWLLNWYDGDVYVYKFIIKQECHHHTFPKLHHSN